MITILTLLILWILLDMQSTICIIYICIYRGRFGQRDRDRDAYPRETPYPTRFFRYSMHHPQRNMEGYAETLHILLSHRQQSGLIICIYVSYKQTPIALRWSKHATHKQRYSILLAILANWKVSNIKLYRSLKNRNWLSIVWSQSFIFSIQSYDG